MNILYSTDDNYAKYAGISMMSLFDKNKDIERINLYIIDNNISKENKEKLKNIVKEYNREIQFIDMKKILTNINNKDGFPISAYARLFVSKIIKEDKLIYIDCDTIINDSLKGLWSINIDGYLVAGVQDNPAIYNVNIIGMNDNDRYINSGMLLMNLELWRGRELEKYIIEFIGKYKGMVPHHDQGIINGVCKDRILILHPRFNLMSQMMDLQAKQIMRLYDIKNYYSQEDIDEAIEKPIIVHYISKFYNRPWNKECTHPLKNLYLEYLNMSCWDNELSEDILDKKTRLRRFVYNNMPFSMYHLLERLLDKKREKALNNKYKFLRED